MVLDRDKLKKLLKEKGIEEQIELHERAGSDQARLLGCAGGSQEMDHATQGLANDILTVDDLF